MNCLSSSGVFISISSVVAAELGGAEPGIGVVIFRNASVPKDASIFVRLGRLFSKSMTEGIVLDASMFSEVVLPNSTAALSFVGGMVTGGSSLGVEYLEFSFLLFVATVVLLLLACVCCPVVFLQLGLVSKNIRTIIIKAEKPHTNCELVFQLAALIVLGMLVEKI